MYNHLRKDFNKGWKYLFLKTSKLFKYMQNVKKPYITLQSSLYWSATDTPAINPTQALSHFCSLMREKYAIKREGKKRQGKLGMFTPENSPWKAMLQVRHTLSYSQLSHSKLKVIFNGPSSSTVVLISRRLPWALPKRGRIVQVCIECKGSLND